MIDQEYKTVFMPQGDLANLVEVTQATVSLWTTKGWLTQPKRVGSRAVYDLRIVLADCQRNCLRCNLVNLVDAIAAVESKEQA